MRFRKVFTLVMSIMMLVSCMPVSAVDYDETMLAPNIVELDSYADVPMDDLAPNTIYVYPTSTVPQSVRKQGYADNLVSSGLMRDEYVPTVEHNVAEKDYVIAGSSSKDLTLYTARILTGKTTYTVTILNLHTKKDVNVDCIKYVSGATFDSFTVEVGKSITTTVSPSYARWYMAFSAPCVVEGLVQ